MKSSPHTVSHKITVIVADDHAVVRQGLATILNSQKDIKVVAEATDAEEVSSEANVTQLLKIRGPYDVNQLAVVAVQAALEKPEYVFSYVREVLEESKPIVEGYFQKKGIRFWPSAANFLLWYPADCESVYQFLKANRVLTRPRRDPKGSSLSQDDGRDEAANRTES